MGEGAKHRVHTDRDMLNDRNQVSGIARPAPHTYTNRVGGGCPGHRLRTQTQKGSVVGAAMAGDEASSPHRHGKIGAGGLKEARRSMGGKASEKVGAGGV